SACKASCPGADTRASGNICGTPNSGAPVSRYRLVTLRFALVGLALMELWKSLQTTLFSSMLMLGKRLSIHQLRTPGPCAKVRGQFVSYSCFFAVAIFLGRTKVGIVQCSLVSGP